MKTDPNDYVQKQNDELLVLQAVFDKDIVKTNNNQNCWKQWAPLEIIIHLTPLLSHSVSPDQVYASLDLDFKCSPKYPEELPEISIKSPSGINTEDIEQIRIRLIEKAQELKGDVMLLELCQMTQELLVTRNKKPEESTYESMIKRIVEKEDHEKRKRAESEKRELTEIAQENERRRLEIQNRKEDEEFEQRKRIKMLNFGELGEGELIEPLDSDKNRRIYKLVNSKARRNAISRYSTEWSAYDKNAQVLVTEWSFTYTLVRGKARKREINFVDFEKSLDSFVQYANSTLKNIKTLDHFVYPYAFVNLKKIATTPTNFNCKVLIGQFIDPEDNCIAQILDTIKKHSDSLLPRLAAQAVCALKWLHEQNLYHGYLQPYSVWFTGGQAFRLSDYILMPHLLALTEEFEKLTNRNSISEPETPSEKNAQSFKDRKKDLFSLGTLLDTVRDNSISNSPSVNSANVQDFIALCQNAKSIDQLMEHKFLTQGVLQMNILGSESDLFEGLGNVESSRLSTDFQIIQWLGKGGYGDVVLARNKLDGNDYAVKRIPLNPKNERLNQKVTREAKLFSKLSNDHVVRYYSAWIEKVPLETMSSISDEISMLRPTTDSSILPDRLRKLETVVENEARSKSVGTVSSSDAEWTRDKSQDSELSVSTESYESEKRDKPKQLSPLGGKLWQNKNGGGRQNIHTLFSQSGRYSHSMAQSEFEVVFEGDSDDESDGDIDNEPISEQPSTSSIALEGRILYIQMEYCSKSTLRNLIDTGYLQKNTSTVWRMFREILYGVQYIHHQGMIHRDIKPGNILLDGNLRIKIGDFGLATRDLFRLEVDEKGQETQVSLSDKNSGLTKDIGTAMYIAPEVLNKSSYSTKFYSFKIDVYSIGIVLFEMFYRPLGPSIERLQILQSLRNTIAYPEDFGENLSQHQKNNARKLITWMLKLDPEERPSIDMLLQSEMIPMIDLESNDFQKMFSQTMKNRKDRLYQWMIDEFLKQSVPPATQYCFDQAICLDQNQSLQRHSIIEKIRIDLEEVFRMRAFQPLEAHLLSLPPTEFIPTNVTSLQQPFTMLDPSGVPVILPTDLRQNFARFVVRNGISRIKRYTFGKIYSKTDPAGGVHPNERLECAVDIIQPVNSANLVIAEALNTVLEIMKTLPVLQGLRYSVRLGHIQLVRAVCIYLGVNDHETQSKILNEIYRFNVSNKKPTIDQKCERILLCADVTQQVAMSLLRLIEPVNTLEELKEQLKLILRSKVAEVSKYLRDSFKEIQSALSSIQFFSNEQPNIVFDLGAVYRPHMFSDGLTMLLQVEVMKNNVKRNVTIVAGGRYDSYLSSIRHVQDPIPPVELCAFGLNVSLEVLAQIQQFRKEVSDYTYSALVCTASSEFTKSACELVNQLWKAQISADILYEPVNSIDLIFEQYKHQKFLLVVIELNQVLVYTKEQDEGFKRTSSFYIAHNRISFEEALRFIHDKLHGSTNPTNSVGGTIPESLQLMLSMKSATPGASASFANVNIVYVMQENPMKNTKKKLEMQARVTLERDVLPKINSKTRLEVFVTELSVDILRHIASAVDRQMTTDEFRQAFDTVSKHAGKHKKDVEDLYQYLTPLFITGHATSAIVLWTRLNENFYKLIA